MPEFTVKEVRLPELHLPEIKREDIVRTLSGARLPEVDLAKARRAPMKFPSLTVSGSDIGRLLAAGATIARLARPMSRRGPWRMSPFGRRGQSPIARLVQPKRRRSRRPLFIGLLVVVIVGAWAVLRRPDVRRRIDAAVEDARARMDQRRAGHDRMAVTPHEPVIMTTTESTSGIEGIAPPTDDADSTAAGETNDDPTARGAGVATPAFEESASS